MNYQHRFRVPVSAAAVADFHSRSAAMPAITPPPILVRVHRAPAVLQEGDEMDFTLWLGPLPVRWLARIEEVTPTSFVDRQLRGPMRRWEHRHTFVAVDDHTTEVRDEVTAEVRAHPLWGPVGLAMVLGLPALFAYRAWKTRRLLMDQTTTTLSQEESGAAEVIEAVGKVEQKLGLPQWTLFGVAGFLLLLAALFVAALVQKQLAAKATA